MSNEAMKTAMKPAEEVRMTTTTSMKTFNLTNPKAT
jgi:hypothetical protein